MENIYNLPRTNKTPEIIINVDDKIVIMRGRCFIINTQTFFVELIEKIKDLNNLTYNFDLEYINSSSLKYIIRMLIKYSKPYKVNWYYQEDDFDIQEKGEHIKIIVQELDPNIKFTLIKKPM